MKRTYAVGLIRYRKATVMLNEVKHLRAVQRESKRCFAALNMTLMFIVLLNPSLSSRASSVKHLRAIQCESER